MVDQNAALGLIDELRVAVPEEVRAAKRINSEGERIIEKAQEEAERIVARAQEQAAFLIDERGLTQAADEESRRIIADAQHDADEIRKGADEYAVSVLIGLEGDVVKTLQSIKKGIAMLDERRAGLAFSLGGMGSASRNFYRDAYARQGYGEVAAEVISAIRPPGFSARRSSANALAGSGTVQSTRLATAASKLAGCTGSGNAVAFPTLARTGAC